MALVEFGLWTCLGLVAYIYVGYFVCAFLLASVLRRNVSKADIEPSITVVISAFNEEQEIQATVVNKLSQHYPSDRLDVIVVSDGSTDRTDDIVRKLADHSEGRVRLLRQEPRQGKTRALNMALSHTSSNIVVFADANSMYAPNALRSLVRNFADPSVGYVTGQMIYTNPAGGGIGGGSGTYMSYENALRVLETRLGSIVGVDGGIDAVRRELYVPMGSDQLPDFVLPLSVVEQGKRVVYESDAKVYEPALADASDEFRMRVRVSLRALWALYDSRHLLNPFRYPLFAWQLISHKVLRYGAFLPIVGLFLLNLMLAVAGQPFYLGFLLLQLIVYAVAALGHFIRQTNSKASKLFVSYYFVVLNAACGFAFWKLLRGQKIVLWKPRQGDS
jgi:cellulose synthase/poly-beta-1,6-N-acetylglucosamine synthase-like glycosyltransferase